MAGTAAPDRAGAVRQTNIEAAEASARHNGLPGYGAWRAGLERRYSVMPRWYWNEQECRRHYIDHIRAAIDWQARERRISEGNANFYRTLTNRL